MNKEEKLIYLMDTCCDSMEDLETLLVWIEEEGIEALYAKIHYLYDENGKLKNQ